MSVGAGINFALLFDQFALILGLTLGLIAIKALVLLALALVFRLKPTDRWLFSLGLAQAGEFGFVLLSFVVAGISCRKPWPISCCWLWPCRCC